MPTIDTPSAANLSLADVTAAVSRYVDGDQANENGFVKQLSATTSIAAGSNGAALPQATISVTSTAGFPPSGSFSIGPLSSSIAYTGTTGTTFTGCSGGSGTLATGQPVQSAALLASTTIAVASNGVAFATTTINVASTTGFSTTGTLWIEALGTQVAYTGVTSTSFTGVTGGTGVMVTGQMVTPGNPNLTYWRLACLLCVVAGSVTTLTGLLNGVAYLAVIQHWTALQTFDAGIAVTSTAAFTGLSTFVPTGATNMDAVVATGKGTGVALRATAGASGQAINAYASSSMPAVSVENDGAGDTIQATSASGTGYAIHAIGPGTGKAALVSDAGPLLFLGTDGAVAPASPAANAAYGNSVVKAYAHVTTSSAGGGTVVVDDDLNIATCALNAGATNRIDFTFATPMALSLAYVVTAMAEGSTGPDSTIWSVHSKSTAGFSISGSSTAGASTAVNIKVSSYVVQVMVCGKQ